MTVTKKAGIFVLVILLLIVAGLIPYLASRPRFVPTVGKLVYLSDLTMPGSQHVWISSPGGADVRELTHGSEHDTGPVFSADGSQITYISDKSGDQEVFVIDADGKNAHPLTFTSDSKSQPAFTPDGHSVSYISHGNLTLVNMQSKATETILPKQASVTGSTTATLSQQPQTSVIRYAWRPSKTGDDCVAAVMQMEDGSQGLQILPKMDADPVRSAVGSLISIAWAPDGGRLAAAVLGLIGINPGKSANLPAGQDLIATTVKGKTPSGIFMFGVDGTQIPGATPLAAMIGASGGPQNPAFSADGISVSFEIWPSATPDTAKIIGIGQEPSDASQRPSVMLRGPVTNLTWAPDGTHFFANVMVKGKPGKVDVIIGDTTTHRVDSLTNHAVDAWAGDWSQQAPKSN